MVGPICDLGLLPLGKRCISPRPIMKQLLPHPCRSWSREAMPMAVGQRSSPLPCISLMETDLPVGQRLVCLEVASFHNTKGLILVGVAAIRAKILTLEAAVALMLELLVNGVRMCNRPGTTNRTVTTQVLRDHIFREVARG